MAKPLPYLRHFFLGSKHLGTGECTYQQFHGHNEPPQSLLFMCPTCGEVWARLPVISVATGKTMRWAALHIPCALHPEGRLLPAGSLSVDWIQGLVESMPDEVVRLEFQTLMNHYQGELS
jgi:hypothetical protein